MDIIIFLLVSIIFLCLLFVHSYYFYGLFNSFNFFFFSFFYIFAKGIPGIVFLNFTNKFSSHSFFLELVHSFLGLILFYISWFMSYKINQYFSPGNNKIFPTAFLSSAICCCFIYAIGRTAISMGYWAVSVVDLFYVTREWFFLSMYFLIAFFLIIFSKFRTKDWKTIFFLIPIIPYWLFHIAGNKAPYFMLQYASLIFFIYFLISMGLEFECYDLVRGRMHSPKLSLLNSLPLLIAGSIILILGAMDIFLVKEMVLLFSLLPPALWLTLALIKLQLNNCNAH